MVRITKSIFLLPAFLWLLGCAQLPEYARPHIVELNDGQAFQKQGFSYRELAVDDFQAPSLPKTLASHTQNIAAYSCCRIRLTKDARYKITRGSFKGQVHYFGGIKYIAFEAVMIPDCSWLNPDIEEENIDYVLQHEQIHFALMELAARELNRKAHKVAQDYLAIQPTYRAAREEIEAKIKQMVRSANEAVLKDHTAFDEDTSLYYDPESQQQWLERVEEQLLKTNSEIENN